MVAFEILKDPSRNRLKFVMLNASVHWLINFFFEKHAATTMLLALLPFCRAASQAP